LQVYLKENPPKDKNIPGPGSYNCRPINSDRSNLAFSLRPRTSHGSPFIDYQKDNPAPGAYNEMKCVENKKGRYIVSNFKSPGAAVIPNAGNRFDNQMLRRSVDIPAPGQYKDDI
jgi:hypothetical protein